MSTEAYVTLSEDMRAIIAVQRLCFAATVTPDGRPNLSPKGTIRVWDDHTLAFLDLASPGTRENLAQNPWMELNVVDTTSRRGYRFLGRASYHRGDEVHNALERRISDEEGHEYAADGVVLLPVERALPVTSPGYAHVQDEWEMRAMWKDRRRVLDLEYETWLRSQETR